jgi:uncharacterized damage-inducible protein DinB
VSGLTQVRALYDYSAWADGHVLDAAARVSEEDLARDLGASFGSVEGNLRHVLSAQNTWLARWTQTAPAPGPELPPGSAVASLRRAYEDSHAAVRRYLSALSEGDLAGELRYTDMRGNDQNPILWKVLLHVANHGTHHRAESAMLLTSLGSAPRQLDYVFFEIERAGGAPRLT